MASHTSRTMIAALQVSLDGYIEGPHGEKDWADSWASALELIPDVDTFVLGARMYPGYGEYWEPIDANPERVPPFQERAPSKSEIAYARLAAKTRHIVLSKTLKNIPWPAAQIIRGCRGSPKGRALFSGVNKRLSLDLVEAKSTESGRVIVTYRIANVANFERVSDVIAAHEGQGQ